MAATDNISHEYLQRAAKAKRSYLLSRLQGNAIAIVTWTEELGQLVEWDLPLAEAIRERRGCVAKFCFDDEDQVELTPAEQERLV